MKNLFLITLIIICAPAVGQDTRKSKKNLKGQTQIDKDAREAANKTCACMDGIIKSLHPTLQSLLRDMMEKTEEEAQTKFTETLIKASDEEKRKVLADVGKMENMETEMNEKCVAAIKNEYAKYDNNAAFKEKMEAYLTSLPECKYTYGLLKAKK